MVATIGGAVQTSNINPFQKPADEQPRTTGTTEQDSTTQESGQTSSSTPVSEPQATETDQESFLNASSEPQEDLNSGSRERGTLLDISV